MFVINISGGQNSGQADPMQSLQNGVGASSFGGSNQQQGMELGQTGAEQQQTMSFKKVRKSFFLCFQEVNMKLLY